MAQYKVIAGTFHVKGFQPDGDSIRFQAVNPANWEFFLWPSELDKISKKKQLRIESIDATIQYVANQHGKLAEIVDGRVLKC
jgi:hypothetical protein